MAELIEAGIVKYLMPAKLDDLIGEPNYLRPRLEYQYETAPDPSMFDLRNLLAEKVALPLGSRFLKAQRQNWFHFFGPSGAGKTLAVRALAT